MARTDPSDSGPLSQRWTFREWLNGVKSWFGGGTKFILPGGGISKQGGAVPALARVARSRMSDTKMGSYRSRMEEAKQKNMMWANNLEPLVITRLKAMFHEDNFKRMRLTPSTSMNQMRRIVEDISILYENPATRFIEEEEYGAEQTAPVIPSKADPNTEVNAADPGPGAAPPKPPLPDAQNPSAPKGPDGKPIPHPTGLPHEQPADPAKAALIGTGDPDIDALAQVLDLEGEAEDKNDTPLDKVMDLCDLDTTLDLVEKMCRFHECIWVRPYVRYKDHRYVDDNGDPVVAGPDGQMPENPGQLEGDPATGELAYIIYDPSNADCVEDPSDPSKMLCWWYWGTEILPNGEVQTVIHYYDDENYWKFDSQWKELYTEPNALGIIPAATFRKEKPTPGSFYCEGTGRDLYEATLELCILKTIRNCRFRDSGFKQLAITAADEEALPADQIMGGPTPIYLPDGATATTLDLQPMITEMTDMCEKTQLEMAAKYGISAAEYKAEGNPQSGFAKKLDRDKVLKENRRIRKFFQEGEQELYEVLAKLLKQSRIEGIEDLDEEACMQVDFAEPSFLESPGEQAAIDSQDMELNKTNIIEVLQRDNPDLNEVELIKKAYKNKRINEAFIPQKSMRLMDLLAAKANVGASVGGPGGGPPPPGEGGGKPPPGK